MRLRTSLAFHVPFLTDIPNLIVDLVLRSPFLDIRKWENLENRNYLLRHSLFVTLTKRIKDLSYDDYRRLCRDVDGKNKPGRVAAKPIGVDFHFYGTPASATPPHLETHAASPFGLAYGRPW